MQIDPYLIRYLERSQRLKFKFIPILHKSLSLTSYSSDQTKFIKKRNKKN